MITLAGFWIGRDKQFADELTREVEANAIETVARANRLLSLGGFLAHDQVASGWRPRGVNERTSNAAANSRHIYGQAIDIADPSREFARWAYTHQDFLVEVALWMEHPDWTWSRHGNHWVHLQTVPPKSGRRVFIPSSAPTIVPYENRMDNIA
jgi:hypothetical protein